MLKVWGHETLSNVQKVLWCCDELGLDTVVEEIGVHDQRHREAPYLKLNPNGSLPTIQDDGFVLWESNAIVRYLAARYGHGDLCPANPWERADADRWMDWQQGTVGTPMRVLARALTRGHALPHETVGQAWRQAMAAWTILDQQLAERAFVAADRLTMGDIALGVAVHRWFSFSDAPHLPGKRSVLPHLADWYECLAARPAYRLRISRF